MKNVSKKRKNAARTKMNSSRKAAMRGRKVLGLNSSKQVDGEWYYSLADVEEVVASVLDQLDSDPGAGITLEPSETGIVLNVVPSDGDEFQVEVELGAEGDETPEAGEGDDEGDFEGE